MQKSLLKKAKKFSYFFTIVYFNITENHIVSILDGYTEKGSHVWSNLGSLICLKHLFRSRAVTNQIFSQKRHIYFPSWVRNMFWVTIWYKYHDINQPIKDNGDTRGYTLLRNHTPASSFPSLKVSFLLNFNSMKIPIAVGGKIPRKYTFNLLFSNFIQGIHYIYLKFMSTLSR